MKKKLNKKSSKSKQEQSGSIRVLHLNTARSWRGGEQQVLYLVQGLSDSGVVQCVSGHADSVLEKRITEIRVPFHRSNPRAEVDLFAARRIARYMNKNNFQLLHAHTGKAHALGLLVKKFFYRDIKLIISRRVDFPARQNFLSKIKYLSPLIDRYIAISDNVKRILMADQIQPEKISVAYSGIDPARFQHLPVRGAVRNEFLISENQFLFLNTAALVDHKDQLTLIRAADLLRERIHDFRILIAGDGELKHRLQNEIEKKALGAHITLLGFRSDILQLLADCDCFVMSSKEEGLGTSVLDAMASGLPVVTTNGGGLPEMIDHRKGGLVVEKENPRQLADAMYEIIHSETLQKKSSKYNRKRVNDFHYKETAKTTLQIYREVLYQ